MAQRQTAKTQEKQPTRTTARKSTARKTAAAGSAESKTTTDHDEIRQWVEARGGRPATVKGTGGAGEAGILRIEFSNEPKLDEIAWDEFFEKFDESNLEFLYQEHLKSGEESRFFKFVKRTGHK